MHDVNALCVYVCGCVHVCFRAEIQYLTLHPFVSTPWSFFVCISLNISGCELLPLLWSPALGAWFISIKCFLYSESAQQMRQLFISQLQSPALTHSPVPCSFAASILRQFCLWPGLSVLEPLRSPAGRRTSAHPPKWGGWKHPRSATLAAIT